MTDYLKMKDFSLQTPPVCNECGSIIKPWANDKSCDTCKKPVCRRHRDFAQFWECKHCRAAKQQFNQIPKAASTEKIMTKMANAENADSKTAEKLIKELYDDIMDS